MHSGEAKIYSPKTMIGYHNKDTIIPGSSKDDRP